MRLKPNPRRRFLASVLGLCAGAGVSGCERRRRDDDFGVLKAVLDTFIPDDEDPGAVQTGVPDRIRERIGRCPVSASRYRRLLSWVAERACEVHGRRFEQLPLPQRERLLRTLYDSRDSALTQLRIDLNVALDDCYHEFYSSPAARSVIGYHPPIEGGYPQYAASPESAAR
jgi:hypothetical protein